MAWMAEARAGNSLHRHQSFLPGVQQGIEPAAGADLMSFLIIDTVEPPSMIKYDQL
jgi:hypothetical protein